MGDYTFLKLQCALLPIIAIIAVELPPLQPSFALDEQVVEQPIKNQSRVALPCPMNCSNHGRCNNGWCLCAPGYLGKDCATVDPFFSKCPNRVCRISTGGINITVTRAFLLNNPNVSMVNLTCMDCGGHGRCNAAGVCDCAPGYHQAGCQLGPTFCPEDYSCFGNGVCNKNGSCDCFTQWGSWNCSELLWSCPNNCTQRGKCLSTGNCLCYKGSTGPDCSIDTYKCPKYFNCSGHGNCVKGKCVCQHGWGAFDCSYDEPTCPDSFDCNHHGACVMGGCICDDGWGGSQCLLPYPEGRKAVMATPTPTPVPVEVVVVQNITNASNSSNASNASNGTEQQAQQQQSEQPS